MTSDLRVPTLPMPVGSLDGGGLVEALRRRADAAEGTARADLLHQAALAAEWRADDPSLALHLYLLALETDAGHRPSRDAAQRLLDDPAAPAELFDREGVLELGDVEVTVALLCARAERLLTMNDLLGASEALSQARALAPDHRRVGVLAMELASLEEAREDMVTAVTAAARATARHSADEALAASASALDARLSRLTGQDDALERLEDALSRRPDDLVTRWALLTQVEAGGDVREQAMTLLDEAQARKDVPGALAATVDAASRLGWGADRFEEGIEAIMDACLRARGESPLQVGAALEVAAALVYDRDPDRELEVLRALGQHVTEKDRQAAVFTRLGRLTQIQDIAPGSIEAEKAMRYAEAAVEAVPGYRAAMLLLDDLHEEGGFPLKARDLLRRRADQQRHPEPLVSAAHLTLDRLSRRDEALVLLRQAIAMADESDLLGPDSPLGNVDTFVAEGADPAGERHHLLREALGRAETALGRRALLRLLVRDAEQRGDLERLVEALGAAVEADPEDLFPLERLADLLARRGAWAELGELRRGELGWLEAREPERALEVMYALGRLCAVALGDDEAALGWYRAILERRPDDLAALAAAGRILVRDERWEELAELHRRELEHTEDPSHRASMAFRLATLHERVLGDMAQARAYYEQVRQLNANHLPTLFGLVRVASATADWPLWAELVDQWCRRERDDVLAGTLACELAQVYEDRLGNLEAAAESYGHAIARLPKLELARLGLVRCLYRLGQVEEAAALIAERLTESDASAVERLDAMDAWVLLQPDEAAAAERLLEDFPDHAPARMAALRNALMEGDLARAARHTVRLSRLLKDSALSGGLRRAAQIMARLGGVDASTLQDEVPTQDDQTFDEMTLLRLEAAHLDAPDLDGFGSLMERRSTAAEDPMVRAAYMTSYGRSLQLRGQYDAALVVYKEALKQKADFVPAAKAQKLLYELLGDREGVAVGCEIEGAIARDPVQAARDFMTAGDLRRRHLGDIEGAILDLETVLRIDPTQEAAFESLREIYSVRGDSQALYELLARRAEAMVDTEERKRLLLIMAQVAFGRLKDRSLAIRCHEQILRLDPDHIQSLRILAEFYQAEQRWEEAVSNLKRVLGAVTDSTLLAMTCRTIAELYDQRLSDPRRAIDAYDTMLLHDATHVPSLRRLGQLLYGERRWEDAARAYGQVLQRERNRTRLLDDLKILARICLDGLKDPERAEQCLTQALRLDSRDLEIHAALVELFDHQGQGGRKDTHLGLAARQFAAAFAEGMSDAEALAGLRQIALWQKDPDRAFLAEAVAEVLDLKAPELREAYGRSSRAARRVLPTAAIPADMTDVALPAELSMSLLHLMRATNELVGRIFPFNPRDLNLSRRTRVGDRDERPGAEALARWPSLFGMTESIVHVAPVEARIPRAWHHDQPLVVIPQDGLELSAAGDPELFFHLGLALAPLSMGIGAWMPLDDATFLAMIAAVVRPYAPSWLLGDDRTADPRINEERVGRAVTRFDDDPTVHALAVSGKLDAAGLLNQRDMLRRAFEKLALILVNDPVPVLKRLGRARGEAALKDGARFLLSERFASLRRAVRVNL